MLINDIKVGDHVNAAGAAPGIVTNINEHDIVTVKLDVPIENYTIRKSSLWKLPDKEERDE